MMCGGLDVQGDLDDDLVNLSEVQKVLEEAKVIVRSFGRQRSCQPGRNVQETGEPGKFSAAPLSLRGCTSADGKNAC